MTPRSALRCLSPAIGLPALLLALQGCGGSGGGSFSSWQSDPETVGGLTRIAYTQGERFILRTKGDDRTFVPGVNIGATIPGRSPGELAIRPEDYRRWFPEIAALGLRAVRVYTILRPHFYRELAAYNRAHPEAPLYLVQGVWIPEAEFQATQDLFDPAVRDGFLRELSDAAAALHGSLQRARRPGVAWGNWNVDVTPWLMAYSIGVEWDPFATSASDQTNAGRPPFVGAYFTSTANASPTESWLAEMLDHLAAEEAARGRTMPLTFTNWITTDPLPHPEEPLQREDLVGVDANHIQATAAWPGGFFASYHAYPYYPDFLRHEPGLQSFLRGGSPDPYAGYLDAIKRHHAGLPVMVTEFGVPSSIGLAHYGPLGRDQGDHSEQEAMSTDAELLRIIYDSGMSGGFLFEWVDEWFKFTWNTIDYELPADRRQLWRNPWTNEEQFGLVSMEPGAAPPAIIDGTGAEWSSNGSQVIYENARGLREVRAVKDEGFLYLRLVLDDPSIWQRRAVTLGFEVLAGGSGGLPGSSGLDPESDYAVTLGPGPVGQAHVRASNDQYVILFGKVRGYFAYDEASLLEYSGVWNPQRLITNRPLTVPSTGESLPVEFFEVGRLLYGTSDPASPGFDSRAVWAAGDSIEIRLPFELIGFADPSSLQALRVGLTGSLSTETVARVGLSVAGNGRVAITSGYSWEAWQGATWHERPKAGLGVLGEAVRDVSSR